MKTLAITISVVSHGQADLLAPLLDQLRLAAAVVPMQVIVTLNLPEEQPAAASAPGFELEWIANPAPQGFAENHNAAFKHCRTKFFCVLNPDVRLGVDSLSPLVACLTRLPGVAGPRVVSERGDIEDSARRVPGPLRLLARWWHRRFEPDYSPMVGEQTVDWLAGMCLMFDIDSYRVVGGFDEKYHLYCEDIDICLKMHLASRHVTWVQDAVVVHNAQRTSHRKLRYLIWHIGSLLKLFTAADYWRFRFLSERAQG
nr:glycosyltransferase family 2 protein [Ralstonia chuxiongensis]